MEHSNRDSLEENENIAAPSGEREVAFGDWLRKQRADVFYGSPTTADLYELFKNRNNENS